MTHSVVNPCGHRVTWDLHSVRDDLQMWFATYVATDGNTYTAQQPGPGTDRLKYCPLCDWNKFCASGGNK
jgi:hypothetical protein